MGDGGLPDEENFERDEESEAPGADSHDRHATPASSPKLHHQEVSHGDT